MNIFLTDTLSFHHLPTFIPSYVHGVGQFYSSGCCCDEPLVHRESFVFCFFFFGKRGGEWLFEDLSGPVGSHYPTLSQSPDETWICLALPPFSSFLRYLVCVSKWRDLSYDIYLIVHCCFCHTRVLLILFSSSCMSMWWFPTCRRCLPYRYKFHYNLMSLKNFLCFLVPGTKE